MGLTIQKGMLKLDSKDIIFFTGTDKELDKGLIKYKSYIFNLAY